MGRWPPVLAVSVAVALAGATLAGCAHGAASAGEAAARLATARSAAHLTRAGRQPRQPAGGPVRPGGLARLPDRRRRPARGRRTWPPGRCTSPVASPLATQTPVRYGYAPFGRHGRAYKVALVVRPGATVTVTIGVRARGHAVIDIPAGE
jgi:hypothetical protein